jgi:hypothetical protein
MKSISKTYPELVFLFIYIKKTKNKKPIATLVIPDTNPLLLNKTNNSSENQIQGNNINNDPDKSENNKTSKN